MRFMATPLVFPRFSALHVMAAVPTDPQHHCAPVYRNAPNAARTDAAA